MMNILILILIISANCVKMNCDEEPSSTENVNGVSEKAELFSANPETFDNKTENKENENDTSNTSGKGEEIRVSRSSSDHSTENETQLKNSSKSLNTEASLTEKSASGEISSETQDKQADNVEDNQPTRRANSASAEEDKKSSEKVEKQLEESTKTTASDTEDRKPKDLTEASAESKLSDNEKASSSVDDTDRNSETEKVKEKSDESLLNEIRATRRMFSAPDNIVVDTKMRADISTTVEPEVRTALNQNLKMYNNYQELGSDSHAKLSDSSIAEPSPMNAKRNMPVITQLASEEILNQRYLSKFYPRPELGIVFPNVNSDYHGPHDLPIYLEVKQGEMQSQNQFTGPQMSQFQSTQENTYFNPNYQQQYHQPQRSLPAQGTFTNKQFENIRIESRNQAPRLDQNQVPTHLKNYIENKKLANLNQGARNQIQKFHQNQEKINPNHKIVGDLNLETRYAEIDENMEMRLKDNDLGNQYPLFRQQQGKIDTKINIEQKQFRTGHLENPYPYFRHPNSQQINVDLIPPNIKVLFQKLASASLYPKNLKTNQNNNNYVQNYPYFAIPGYTAGFSFNLG